MSIIFSVCFRETSLTKEIFGDWASFVENSVESIVAAIESLSEKNIDLSCYRDTWNESVNSTISNVEQLLVIDKN